MTLLANCAALMIGCSTTARATQPAKSASAPGSQEPGATLIEQVHAPFTVRVVWSDQSVYRGGVGWSLKGTCDNGKSVSGSLRTTANEWIVDWPTECGSGELHLELHLQVNWMRCPSQLHSARVGPGGLIIVSLSKSSSCKAHADDAAPLH